MASVAVLPQDKMRSRLAPPPEQADSASAVAIREQTSLAETMAEATSGELALAIRAGPGGGCVVHREVTFRDRGVIGETEGFAHRASPL